MYAKIALFSAPFSTLIYSLPPAFPISFWQPGLRVLVPVGKSLRSGCMLELSGEHGLADAGKCRPVVFPLETQPLLIPELISLAADLSTRQGLTPGMVLGHVLPAGLRRPDTRVVWKDGSSRRMLSGRQITFMPESDYARLAGDLLKGNATFSRTSSSAEIEIYSIAVDPPWPLRPAATKQIEIMDFLHENGATSRALLTKKFGPACIAPLRKLADSGLVEMNLGGEEDNSDEQLLPPAETGFTLNEEQQTAFADLKAALLDRSAQTRLLYGVTGSGKTAIYLRLAEECLRNGRSCLLLAPEVALSHKLYRDVSLAFPDAPRFLYHGYQHPVQREKLFQTIAAQKTPCIIVGTRSALFLPVARPGCIIMDEEHDGSWKQDENLPYHAREVAWFRSQQVNGLLVLGSATPDIRTFNAWRKGLLPALVLRKRATGGSLPPIELLEISPEAGFSATPSDQGLLTRACEEQLTDCLKKGEQAVILLNRRGYAPLIYCLSCEKTLHCPHCQIGLAFHKGVGRLVCHYCGYSIPWPAPCPECGDTNYISIGEGTERITERLEALAGQPVLRLDRDSARRTGRIDEILTDFGAGHSPFLVGTQMLSKGHHFPNVTLVVVADGDIGLNLPDYRASERTFQLLLQSAGRAGRGSKPGKAIIQTRNPGHYCWQHVTNYDYEGFFEAELAIRRQFDYPPFTRLGLLRISWPAIDDEAAQAARELGLHLRQAARERRIKFMGPAPAPIAMIKGRKRMQCLIKAKDWQPMRELWFLAQKHRSARKLRITLDLDPVNMM